MELRCLPNGSIRAVYEETIDLTSFGKCVVQRASHVEPDEHPAAAARRECREELGVGDPILVGPETPAFLTVTTTVGRDHGHTDVSLWFIFEGSRDMQLTVDEVEFRDVRWWSLPDVASAEGKEFDPQFPRSLQKARSLSHEG